MNKKQHKSKTKLYKKRTMTIVLLLLVIMVGLLGYFLIVNKSISWPGVKKDTSGYYKPGTGGDVLVFNRAYEDALVAWKSGDKEKAKELAQKGLDENEKLSVQQQETIDYQIEKIRILYDLTKGRYFEG